MITITAKFLEAHPTFIFVFGDNILRVGHGGAAALRDIPNTYGFITKIRPDNDDSSFFTKEEYGTTLDYEISLLTDFIDRTTVEVFDYFLISKLGAGLANKYDIWGLIEPKLAELNDRYDEVVLLYGDDENVAQNIY